MATTTTLGDGYKTTIESRHHIYHADEPIDDGGTDTAATPMEMMQGALGSCIAITMKMYANRKGWDVGNIRVVIDTERFAGKDYEAYDGDERFIHEVRKYIEMDGDLDEKQTERMLDIAGKCPVHRLIVTPTFTVTLEEWVDEQISLEE